MVLVRLSADLELGNKPLNLLILQEAQDLGRVNRSLDALRVWLKSLCAFCD